MNLPHHRQAINGRTFSQPWEPTEMDPFRHYRKPLDVTPLFVGAVSALGAFVLLAVMFAERFGWL